ncbi:GGDEF domain-containing protein [Manganibacter manganicus]|uniref:diguanylate cyclase n=1 Tax=Manganibacter manganicus TaxID=1873176 RepID=A0A1V8RVF8_9HYPH|nr:GGDEF domain-containing protein [Pseudaminobacter manganicus]OQM77162.1 diguanylate cyclase [Pseudaminobacter manganicus]
MDTGLFLALLNPSIALVLAAAFGALWAYQKNRSYLAVLAIGYVATAIGFLLQHFVQPLGLKASQIASSLAFMVAVCLISGAIVSRYRNRLPLVGIGIAASVGAALYGWFMFVDQDLIRRILVLNFAFGAISLVVAAELWGVRKRGPAETVLLVLSLLASMNFIVRTLIVLKIEGPIGDHQGFLHSTYWTTAMLSHAVLTLMLALCLFTAAALDVVAALRSDSHTDALSGLFNRRGFEEQALEALARCAPTGLPVSLVLADLDHFKAVNDSFGHAEGDRVIANFAGVLRRVAGTQGIPGRIGGEEFAVLLPLADLAAARLFAETVRAGFGLSESGGMRVTASFGIAMLSHDEPLHRLMQRADDALYRAKQSGRDGVRVVYERSALSTRVDLGGRG